jgi:hypothetical protein
MKADEIIPKVKPSLKDSDLSKGGIVNSSVVTETKQDAPKKMKTEYKVLIGVGIFFAFAIIYKLVKKKQ